MLTGQELLSKVKEMGDAPKTELATACGYVSKKKDGSDRVNFTAFYEALLNAKGIDLGSGASGLKMVNRGGDAYLYQRGDLMAVVEDAAGDLQRSGNYLV